MPAMKCGSFVLPTTSRVIFMAATDYYFLFRMTKAAMTPGIQPARVRMNTMTTEPQPWSSTAKGGEMMERRTLNNDILFSYAFD